MKMVMLFPCPANFLSNSLFASFIKQQRDGIASDTLAGLLNDFDSFGFRTGDMMLRG